MFSITPSVRKRRTFSSPRPSMSMAPTKCLTAWKTWPGQPVRLGQIVHTPPSALTVGVPQAGHFAGGSVGALRPLRFCAFAVGDTTCGITSPARMTITSSPSRTSLRRRSSSLCSVASFTVTPETCTGSSIANGTMWPVRPTFQATPLQRGGGRGGRELPRDRAARLAADHAELALQLEVVHLHHHAVDLEVEPVAPLLPGAAGRDHLVDAVVDLHVPVHLEAVLPQPLERLAVGLERDPLERPHAVAPDRQRPRRGELGVELADRAGGGVARVGEGRLARLGALLVQPGESRQRQVDLAAHLQQRRRVVDAQRDRPDRAQVLGHVLADLAVAARGAAHEHAVLVDERDRQAVDLRLGHEADVAHLDSLAGEVALRAQHPGGQLLLVARVGERQHRLQVAHLLELVERLGAHALGGRVGRAQLGVLRLEVAQLVQQRVVVGVRDLGVVEDVVAVVVVLERPPQLGRAVLGGRAHTSRAAGSSSAPRSKPASSSTPAWSVRSKWSGVTAMQPSAIAAKSVPSSCW